MTKFKNIQDWLKSNPSKEELEKIMILINRGETSRARKAVWEKERYLIKLQSFSNHCKKLGFAEPKDNIDAIAKTKKEIETLKKDLPPVVKREKKSEVNAAPQE